MISERDSDYVTAGERGYRTSTRTSGVAGSHAYPYSRTTERYSPSTRRDRSHSDSTVITEPGDSAVKAPAYGSDRSPAYGSVNRRAFGTESESDVPRQTRTRGRYDRDAPSRR